MGRVIELTLNDDWGDKWNDFLINQEHLLFHTPMYKNFLDKAFNSKTLYYAYFEEEIKTIMPFISIKHFFGNKIISTAYIEYGGPCGDQKYVPDIINHVYGKFNQVEYIEVRQGLEKFDRVLADLMMRSVDYKRFVLPLCDVDKTFNNIDKAKRKTIKKAERSGIITKWLERRDLDEFYELYLKNMDLFVSPPYSKKYFEAFFEFFGGEKLSGDKLNEHKYGRIMGAFYEDKLVAGLVGLVYQDIIHVIIAVSDTEYQMYRVNDAAHWAFIKWGCQNKIKTFDFGRVREDSGQYIFKKRFGAVEKNLNHYYLLIRSKVKPIVDPSNPKFKLKLKVWKLLPRFIKRRIGHWVREGLGI